MTSLDPQLMSRFALALTAEISRATPQASPLKSLAELSLNTVLGVCQMRCAGVQSPYYRRLEPAHLEKLRRVQSEEEASLVLPELVQEVADAFLKLPSHMELVYSVSQPVFNELQQNLPRQNQIFDVCHIGSDERYPKTPVKICLFLGNMANGYDSLSTLKRNLHSSLAPFTQAIEDILQNPHSRASAAEFARLMRQDESTMLYYLDQYDAVDRVTLRSYGLQAQKL